MSDQDFIAEEATEDAAPSEHSQDSAGAGEAVKETSSDDQLSDHDDPNSEQSSDQDHDHGRGQQGVETTGTDDERYSINTDVHDDPEDSCDEPDSDNEVSRSSLGDGEYSEPEDDSDESA